MVSNSDNSTYFKCCHLTGLYLAISAQPHCDSESSSWDHSQETQNPNLESPDSALHPQAATLPVWFLREQFFPQTLPWIIRPQLPLVLLHFGMLPIIWVLAKLQNCTWSQCSRLRSGSRISCDVETSGAAHSPAAPLSARVGKLILTLLSSPGWLWIASPDENLMEREDPVLLPSALCFCWTPIGFQPGRSWKHICQHSHYQSLCRSTSLKQRSTPHDHSQCCCTWEEKCSPNHPA